MWHQESQILLQKEGNMIKQEYKKQQTAVQIIKNQHKSSTENKKTEELKSNPMHGQFYRTLTDHQ
jgi:hemerythrin superfamily protein